MPHKRGVYYSTGKAKACVGANAWYSVGNAFGRNKGYFG